MNTVNIGIISFAHFHGFSYAKSVQDLPNGKLIAVADDDKQRGKKAAKQYGVDYFDDYQKMLKRDDIDSIITTAENVKHPEIVIAAAESGKNILCEKPLATTVKDADSMLRAAEKSGVTLATAFPMRSHQTCGLIKNILDKKTIGKIIAITATNHLKWLVYGWFIDPSLSGGGMVMDHTVHDADLMRWYVQSEAKSVYTEIGKNIHKDIKVEDNALTMITFKNRVFGSIDGSWSRPSSYYTWGDVTLEILGTEGLIQLDVFRQNINIIETDKPKDRLELHYWGCDADQLMVKNFIDSIQNDKEPIATGYDGRQATEITVAAYESARKGEAIMLQ